MGKSDPSIREKLRQELVTELMALDEPFAGPRAIARFEREQRDVTASSANRTRTLKAQLGSRRLRLNDD